MTRPLTWCEVDGAALNHNIREIKANTPHGLFGAVVKSNAYGHGLALASRAFVEAGADWLVCQNIDEAQAIREAGLAVPILIVGYVPPRAVGRARELGCHIVCYDPEVVAAAAALPPGEPLPLHIKIETGNHRQGLPLAQALELAQMVSEAPGVRLAGISSHFANVEDTTDHRFARQQLEAFSVARAAFADAGYRGLIPHVANSAATILWPEAQLGLCRAGLICYGMWPSPETLVSTILGGRPRVELRPALTWKAEIVQVKDVPSGSFIGYGCTYMATHDSRIAVVPVGYFEGYDRRLSNLAHVLIHGCRAPVRGRVCMNFIMVDVTDIPQARSGDEAVLLGRQGDETVTAEQIGAWIGTINYEVTTRISVHIPRLLT